MRRISALSRLLRVPLTTSSSSALKDVKPFLLQQADSLQLVSVCFRLKADGEGTYQCTETGLIFEVTRKVDIKYCILSWSKYADLVVKPWVVGGPLFDVNCEPGGLSSIQFPHSLCLASKYLTLLRAWLGGVHVWGWTVVNICEHMWLSMDEHMWVSTQVWADVCELVCTCIFEWTNKHMHGIWLWVHVFKYEQTYIVLYDQADTCSMCGYMHLNGCTHVSTWIWICAYV